MNRLLCLCWIRVNRSVRSGRLRGLWPAVLAKHQDPFSRTILIRGNEVKGRYALFYTDEINY